MLTLKNTCKNEKYSPYILLKRSGRPSQPLKLLSYVASSFPYMEQIITKNKFDNIKIKENYFTMELEDNRAYFKLVENVKKRILSARISTARTISRSLTDLYWDIGKMLVEKQEKEGWGKSVVEKLSQDLQKEYPGKTGFSSRNLWDMKRFYEQYSNQKLRQAVAEIPWGHNLLIMNKISNYNARSYYIEATRRLGWSRNVLLNQIKSEAYERSQIEKKTHTRGD